MDELMFHTGLDKVSMTVVGQAYRERQMGGGGHTEQIKP